MADPEPEQDGAAAYFGVTPFDVNLEIVRRLPSKSIIRLRAVCPAWRAVTSDPAFVAALHRHQPSQPLLRFGLVACHDRYVKLRDYCVEALDLRSDELRSILRFTDNELRGCDEVVRDGDEVAPIHADVLVYGSDDEGDRGKLNPQLLVHASLDGLLLVSVRNAWYVCNPATRQWAALPELDYRDVVGLYRYVPSGEYRVLYHTGQDDEDAETCYYVLTVGSQKARSIGCPVSAAAEDLGLAIGLDHSSLSPPVQLRGNLHWPPQDRQSYHILVFDTQAEVFSWMKSPVRTRSETMNHLAMRLLELEEGRLGMSVSRINVATLQLWRLEDYQNSTWVMLYEIKLPVLHITSLLYEDWLPSVVSPQGDVLIVRPDGVLHCDRDGNVLQSFLFPDKTELVSIRHRLKESLIPHAMFLAPKTNDAVEPPFFRGL